MCRVIFIESPDENSEISVRRQGSPPCQWPEIIYGSVMIRPEDVSSLNIFPRVIHPCDHYVPVSVPCPKRPTDVVSPNYTSLFQGQCALEFFSTMVTTP